MPDLTVGVQEGSPCRVTIGGDIDLGSVAQVDAAFAGLAGDVAVDCTELKFIGSDGFHSFDRAYRAATSRGATFEVSGMGRFHTRIAEILGVPYVSKATP